MIQIHRVSRSIYVVPAERSIPLASTWSGTVSTGCEAVLTPPLKYWDGVDVYTPAHTGWDHPEKIVILPSELRTCSANDGDSYLNPLPSFMGDDFSLASGFSDHSMDSYLQRLSG